MPLVSSERFLRVEKIELHPGTGCDYVPRVFNVGLNFSKTFHQKDVIHGLSYFCVASINLRRLLANLLSHSSTVIKLIYTILDSLPSFERRNVLNFIPFCRNK